MNFRRKNIILEIDIISFFKVPDNVENAFSHVMVEK
jgi:hypothetical protein